MLIKALCDYYDSTAAADESSCEYLSEQNVHYMIMLNPDGTIGDILDIRRTVAVPQKNGKEKTVTAPVAVMLPKRTQKTSIDLNIIEHRPLYIFGLNCDKGVFTPSDKTDKAKKSHECFAVGNLDFCADIGSELVQAYCRFIESWVPENECENPFLLKIAKDYAACYYCFGLAGRPEITLHNDKALIEKYAREYESKKSSAADSAECQICPIEGKMLPTARIHEKISGVKGGNATGCVLVGIKESAFESYGKTQSFNSGISDLAMKKYTSALNNLISDKHHRIFADDMTVLFFAISENDENECDFFSYMMSGSAENRENNNLKAVAGEILAGRSGDLSALGIDKNVTFYVMGITPNSARISQKFIYKDTFGSIIGNVVRHQRDMAVDDSGRQVALYQINKQLISPKSSKQQVPPPLTSALFTAILKGTAYPDALLSTVITRVKTDSDTDTDNFVKINDTRIGIIKACLNRKGRLSGNKEEISMALDNDNRNSAYVCGRLFAMLEYIQQRASGGGLNRTIKDSFFATAASKPSTVFPRLIKLAQNHMSKLDSEVYWNKEVGSIIDMLNNEFPQTLSLDEQGKFIIGYYHQNKALYTKKTNE